MLPNPAGQAPATPSTTARPAEKGTSGERLDPAVVSRSVDALVTLAAVDGRQLRRKEARAAVVGWTAGEPTPSELDAYLRVMFKVDPTGVTAARNVDRERGAHRLRASDQARSA